MKPVYWELYSTCRISTRNDASTCEVLRGHELVICRSGHHVGSLVRKILDRGGNSPALHHCSCRSWHDGNEYLVYFSYILLNKLPCLVILEGDINSEVDTDSEEDAWSTSVCNVLSVVLSFTMAQATISLQSKYRSKLMHWTSILEINSWGVNIVPPENPNPDCCLSKNAVQMLSHPLNHDFSFINCKQRMPLTNYSVSSIVIYQQQRWAIY